MPKRTKRCPYCEGSGKSHQSDEGLPWNCVDCWGSGQRCILCGHPEVNCECPDSAFDGDYSELDRPKQA